MANLHALAAQAFAEVCNETAALSQVHGVDVNKVGCTYCGKPIRPLV